MADRMSRRSGEWRWVMVAIAIILAGVVLAMLYRMDAVPTWMSFAGTFLMAAGAFAAALAAGRAARESGGD